MTSQLITIARMEFTATERVWWIRLLTAAYALITVAMAYASGVVGETARDEAFARLTVAVLPLALTLVPLRVYLKNGRLKCELALAKGRKLHDKREVSRMKTIDKEARQAISQRK